MLWERAMPAIPYYWRQKQKIAGMARSYVACLQPDAVPVWVVAVSFYYFGSNWICHDVTCNLEHILFLA